jgi:ABC-2 type transport system permease protein
MQAYFTLVRRELGSHFYSWTGYVVIGIVLFLIGFSFADLLRALNAEATDRPVTELFYITPYFWLILVTAAPVITMRSFAQEKYSGTFETLMTTPVSDLQVVMGKFTGAMLFYVLMWLPLVACLYVVQYYSNGASLVQPSTLSGALLGIFLLGALYMSIGCWASSLTRNQIIAAMITFGIGISLFLISFFAGSFSAASGLVAQLMAQLALVEHMKDFSRGIVDTRPVVFYISFTILFLFLNLKVVESRRWK